MSLELLDQICGDLGMMPDPVQAAYKAALELFHQNWKCNEFNGEWRKSVRIYLIPNTRSGAYGKEDQDYWGRQGFHNSYFSVNETDCKYLAPLDLEDLYFQAPDKNYHDVKTNTLEDLFHEIARIKGVTPQFIDFKELILEGVEVEMVITNDRYQKAKEKAEGAFCHPVEHYLGKDGILGNCVRRAECKPVSIFLAWVVWGLHIPSSSSVSEVSEAIEKNLCPTLPARDPARARHILHRFEDIFGSRGNACRNKTNVELTEMVLEFDTVLVSMGVTPPTRGALKIKKID